MKNVSFLTLLLGCLLVTGAYGQQRDSSRIDDWKSVAKTQHQSGHWLGGAGVTILGGTAKVGRFVANRTWLGASADVHNLLSDRREIGVYGRYYLWNGGFVSGFSELGVSYGRFQVWQWFPEPNDPPTPIYRSAKLNAALGLEYPAWRRVALEGVVRVGRLTQTNWIQPSVQFSVNVYLGRKGGEEEGRKGGW